MGSFVLSAPAGGPQCGAAAARSRLPPPSPPPSFLGGWDAEDVTQPGSVKGEAMLGGPAREWEVEMSN